MFVPSLLNHGEHKLSLHMHKSNSNIQRFAHRWCYPECLQTRGSGDAISRPRVQRPGRDDTLPGWHE